MKIKMLTKRKILYALLTFLFTANVYGQMAHPNAWSSSGGHYDLTGCSIDWTLGEWMVETHSSHPILEQGFLHAYDFNLMTTHLANPKIQVSEMHAWPNPTSNTFKINLGEMRKGHLYLINQQGHVIKRWDLEKDDQVYSVEHLPSGSYRLWIELDKKAYYSGSITIVH